MNSQKLLLLAGLAAWMAQSPSSSVSAAGLEQLPYGPKTLESDLGVGLWAWPMPLDYDGDGDLDLLVGCPDKPSNGIYLFENPGKANKAKMPVFKAGRRLAGAPQNLQVSYVNGEARILKPGFEYVDFRENNFSKTQKIHPQSNPHRGGVRANMWRYVDYDGDGDQDLVVGSGDWSDYVWDFARDAQGVWHNGPLHGYVYLMRNSGTDKAPKYEAAQRIQAGGNDIDVYGWPSPNFGDFDHDGDLDLLCGEFMDGFTYFENTGTRTRPHYANGRKLVASNGEPLHMDLQMITPTAIDWDGDGDLDLITGDEDGRVALVENAGRRRAGTPVFHQPVYFRQEADTLKFGALATPFVCDWDGDGDEDILCGNTAGYIGFFENLGGGAKPHWAEVKYLEAGGRVLRIQAGPTGSIQGPCEAKWGYTTLTAADWDGDGLLDILLNSIWGEILWCRNIGTAKAPALAEAVPVELSAPMPKPEWFWWDGSERQLVTQWRTTPVAIDFTRDGLTDLVLLDSEGYLCLYERSRGDKGLSLAPPRRIFVDEDLNPIQLNNRTVGRSGRYKVAVVDWDGDGRLDVLVNSENATWYRNVGEEKGLVVLKKLGNLDKRNVAGHTSSPTVCDFDKDGKPDLLVGAEDGRLYHMPHAEAVQFSAQDMARRQPAKAKPANALAAQPGVVSEEFIFTKADFEQCHASTICKTPRGLVAAWFGGTKEGRPDVSIWTSYNDGGGWSRPSKVADGVQHLLPEGEHRWPCWNPVLFQPPGDAPTQLFFKVGPKPDSWWGERLVSYDRGRSWRDRERLPEGIDGPVKNKPVLLADGRLLAPSSTEYDGWRVHFEESSDMGQTWRRIGPINDGKTFNAIQPSILIHQDGSLQVLCRSRENRITTSWSRDGGRTWSEMEATSLPNPNSGTDAVTLADGRHLLVYNHTSRDSKQKWPGRAMLNVAISDNGKDWKPVLVLEQERGGEFSYPAVIQTADGLVHITYTWKRQRVRHVVVDPAGLRPGSYTAEGNWPDSMTLAK